MRMEKAIQNKRYIVLTGAILCSIIVFGCFGKKTGNSQETIETNRSVTSIEKVQEEDTNKEPQQFEAMEKAPVDPARNDLIANMRNESIKQTIENIPNFDDASLAGTSISDAPLSTSAKYKIKYVTRLMRVRKLYAIGQKNPDSIIPDLRNLLRDSLKEWPEALRTRSEDYKNGNVKYSEPDDFLRVSDYCLVATYLLAEFCDYDSLPLLSQQYKMESTFGAPVPPAITFYAMHRLASSYPRNFLSAEATNAIDVYFEAAEELVPDTKQIKVTVWDSSYSESDPRLTVLGVKGPVLEGQESMTMPLYPVRFKDDLGLIDAFGTLDFEKAINLSNTLNDSDKLELIKKIDDSEMQDGNGTPSKKLDELFNKLDIFVQIVYPPNENILP